jgi:hypothetical protein
MIFDPSDRSLAPALFLSWLKAHLTFHKQTRAEDLVHKVPSKHCIAYIPVKMSPELRVSKNRHRI